ncbi:MAG: hypothetical protein KKB31_00480 [Nanoarchaeota archaeon]|nr:hypothetical protein [Nanoarchaeota archaeon]
MVNECGVTREEFRGMLTQHKKRSLAQKIRHLNKKWAKEEITAKELVSREEKLYKDLIRDANKRKRKTERIELCDY